MSTHLIKKDKILLNEDINVIENDDISGDFSSVINQQIKQTNIINVNLLQQIQRGIYLLTVRKNDTANYLRKLSDRAQYAILPALNNNESFYKLSINSLKNYCHGTVSKEPISCKILLKGPCRPVFYFHFTLLEKLFREKLETYPLSIKEMLSNKIFVISDGVYSYPLSLSKLASLAIWKNQNFLTILDEEIDFLFSKFQLFEKLFSALKNNYNSADWSLVQGQMRYTQGGMTRPFDYASLLDDILYCHFKERMEEYLSFFRVYDLDASLSFPTVSVRSLVHLKARPQSLSRIENGYAIAASVERLGAQTPIDWKEASSSRAFSLWITRAERHLFRHNYQARVIFLPRTPKSFSLVGEQVATIALFPGLLKGVFETLNIETPKSVRLIAHNEDVLTIAHDTASWVDINDVNQRASTLFRLISNDGADPLSLFEQVLLPDVGVGNFQFKIVPHAFFELITAAESKTNGVPPGHCHYLLGLAFECLHEWGLAVAEFQKALRTDANDADILHALGCALMEIGQTEASLPFLKRAFDLMPEDPEIANNWGRSNIDCGHLEDAIAAFERAVRLVPGSADYLKNLGNGYLLAARPVDALDMLNKAVKCNPDLAEAHATLAHIHLAYGDESLARKHALIAYNENPCDPNIANILWRLTLGKKLS